MKARLLGLFYSIAGLLSLNAQEITGEELLEKAIAYHDPNGVWEDFQAAFVVQMTTPDRPVRTSSIQMDFPKQLFDLAVERGEVNYRYSISPENCAIYFNGETEFSDEVKEQYRLNCDRGSMMKDYYTYLYGLPMKLKDPGTIVDPKVTKKRFKGKRYLVLKVSYDQEVGKDTWYFYFDPKTYAMEVYQFYHDESKNDGEYILLSGLEDINGIQMPKKRDWYYNSNDKFLGSDLLIPNEGVITSGKNSSRP